MYFIRTRPAPVVLFVADTEFAVGSARYAMLEEYCVDVQNFVLVIFPLLIADRMYVASAFVGINHPSMIPAGAGRHVFPADVYVPTELPMDVISAWVAASA